MTMLKAFHRPSHVSRALSATAEAAPPGGCPQVLVHAQGSDDRQRGPEETRSGMLQEDGTQDGADGQSSSVAPVSHGPLFYAGVMLRGHKNDLVRFFELPTTESLRGDFHCAMRKRVLLQGRMYIFDHYVCFYSAVFGFAKKRKIHMRTIQAVRKKTHLGFPNSLEIESDERKDFYTSFLSREEAYQLMQRLVPEAKRKAENGELPLSDAPAESSQAGAGGGSGSSPGAGQGEGQGQAAQRQPSGARAARGSGLAGRPEGAPETLLTRGASGSMADEDGNDDGSEEESRVWVVEQRPAPPVATGSRHVLHGSLPGVPRDFFDVVLADSAPFLEDFLDSQGNRRINLTSWKRHPQLGHVRDLHFTAPIKGAFGNWGVSHTACSQTQRFCLYSEEHIVFESSQTMTDIPYGDCFTVDQRWDIRRDPQSDPDKPHMTFDLHVRVPFTSRCLFKGVIESGSVKQVQETYTQFIEQLRPVLGERLVSRNTLNLRDPSSAGGAGGAGGAAAAPTPRVRSMAPGGMRPLPSMGRLNSVPSMSRIASMASPRSAFEEDPELMGAGGSSVSLGRHGRGAREREPGVGRLLLSLGRRLGEGVRGLLESGIDVVLNISQCQCTPQMRFLVGLVLLMFLANLACIALYVWPGPGTVAGAGPVATAATTGGFVPVAADGGGGSAAGLGFAEFAAGGGEAGVGMGGGGGGVGGGAYWLQRMASLQQELQLLQGRLELVLREVAMVQANVAGAAAGPEAVAAAAVGQEL